VEKVGPVFNSPHVKKTSGWQGDDTMSNPRWSQTGATMCGFAALGEGVAES
jgi:hypothetical protein